MKMLTFKISLSYLIRLSVIAMLPACTTLSQKANIMKEVKAESIADCKIVGNYEISVVSSDFILKEILTNSQKNEALNHLAEAGASHYRFDSVSSSIFHYNAKAVGYQCDKDGDKIPPSMRVQRLRKGNRLLTSENSVSIGNY